MDGDRFQRVDLFVDAHRAQLRGDACAEGRRQADPGDDGRGDADIDEGRRRNPVSASMPILPSEL